MLGAGDIQYDSLNKGKIFDMPMTTGYLQSATVLSDLAGENWGTLNGGYTVGTSATEFNGSTGYGVVSDSNNLDVQAITISAWVNLDTSPSAAAYIAGKLEDTGNEASYGLYINSNKKVGLYISEDGNLATPELTNAAAVTLNNWHHITATYETGTYLIYVDNILVASDGNGDATGTIYQGTGRLALASRYDSGDVAYKLFFDGELAHARIWNRVLTTAEITQEYNRVKGTYQP